MKEGKDGKEVLSPKTERKGDWGRSAVPKKERRDWEHILVSLAIMLPVYKIQLKEQGLLKAQWIK
jgi:hypothetical protein